MWDFLFVVECSVSYSFTSHFRMEGMIDASVRLNDSTLVSFIGNIMVHTLTLDDNLVLVR